ncbi:MAG: trypsin-like peptidase domain-containing protein [Planctomycetota bacterium]
MPSALAMDLDRPPPPPHRAPGFSLELGRVAMLLCFALAAYLAWDTFAGRRGPRHDPDAAPRVVAPRGDLAADEQTTIALFEAVSPSVVHIDTARLAVRRGFFRSSLLEVPEGTGSGFLWDAAGHVVTNFHVIRGADTAEVHLQDRSSWRARLVGYAAEYDLAVLQVDAPAGRLAPIAIGTSEDLQVGQKVFAIGNPFGLDQTLTTGVISGLDRVIMSVAEQPIRGVIQTDAAINPGNSGGPLLDSAGRLIGVNTMIYSTSGANAGVGFAVPVDLVNEIVPQLIRTGRIEAPAEGLDRRAVLGITMESEDFARAQGTDGVVVREVLDESGAAAAGLRGLAEDRSGRRILGDVILAIDGQPIRSRADLIDALEDRRPGQTVRLRLERGPRGDRRIEEIEVMLR